MTTSISSETQKVIEQKNRQSQVIEKMFNCQKKKKEIEYGKNQRKSRNLKKLRFMYFEATKISFPP